VALTGSPPPGSAGSPIPGSFARAGRGAKLLGGGRSGTVISTVSTVVVLGVLAAIFLLAPGARAVEHAFFSPQHMWQSFIGNPQQGYYSVGAAIWLNIQMFLVAEVLILVFALLIALIRQSAHPALFPIRILATGYVDFFRGVPLILVIFAGMTMVIATHEMASPRTSPGGSASWRKGGSSRTRRPPSFSPAPGTSAPSGSCAASWTLAGSDPSPAGLMR
jgi:hypothetical protein